MYVIDTQKEYRKFDVNKTQPPIYRPVLHVDVGREGQPELLAVAPHVPEDPREERLHLQLLADPDGRPPAAHSLAGLTSHGVVKVQHPAGRDESPDFEFGT